MSGWQLARAVSLEGELGVVSGTGINSILIRRLQLGDPDGHVRRALAHFFDRSVAEQILETYFVEGGIAEEGRFKRSAVPSVHPHKSLQRLYVVASFVEVWLAKEGHEGIVGINFLEKLQTTNLPAIYGAMLAGVDVVLMGAGVPREIPGVLDRFANHEEATIKVSVTGASPATDVTVSFCPTTTFPNANEQVVHRPMFLPIISSSTLATHLIQRSTGSVDGFVVEGILAGGHNAPPRGPMKLNDRGEPVYGPKDEADLKAILDLGLPIWLAGSYGSPDRLIDALASGANGIQVGTAFAFCRESGLATSLRDKAVQTWATDTALSAEPVFTDPLASPTGFPFKVVQMPGTLSDNELYNARPRKCDLGYLRQVTVRADGELVYRCPAEPVADYVKKGGDIADTVNRKCLCNALLANIGLGQTQKNGYHELPLLTAGDDLIYLRQFLPPGQLHYTASDVLNHLKSKLIDPLESHSFATLSAERLPA